MTTTATHQPLAKQRRWFRPGRQDERCDACGVRGSLPSVEPGALRGTASRQDNADTERSTGSGRLGSDQCAVRDRAQTVRLRGSRRGDYSVRGQDPTCGHTERMKRSGV